MLRTPHSTGKRTRKNKSVGDPPACGCTGAEIVALLAAYLYDLAGAETGDFVEFFINGAGEIDAQVIPSEVRFKQSGPNGPTWTAVPPVVDAVGRKTRKRA